MKTRKMGYSDYGFRDGEAKQLQKYCRRPDFAESFLLKEACQDSNENIADDLYCSIVHGISYNKLTRKKYIPLPEVDFYGYRRKALFLFWEALWYINWGEERHKENNDKGYWKGEYSMTLSRYEQETIINFNAEEDTAELYTADPVWMRKFDKLVERNPEQFKPGQSEKYEGKVIAKRYIFPKRFISIRSKDKKSTMTDGQKEAAAKRMKELRGMC